ncbi:phage tail protein [Klebsiella pneumoniae]|uniref:phage tail protein n=1 Tax=Klebsiella TaxID=570 RepID=UPI001F3A8BD5|nr:phage tail protein [Klebsiella pneumoniae]HDU3887894.1 phage tail protein [Klebsiella pneumoniae subsp. pneumoniae]MCX3086532.1 phage tail protein [Klebsiella pneumoniae]MCX3091747.1 phage tail protein [Klebsiella pneumoniae]MCX3096964.1 phage tail protein [Klebsiella pneumoniae]MCX3102177.1 phage tail protein [Klebsiella pneumoniae]
MSEGEKVGGIYIEIEAETAKLLTGQQQANKALDSIGDHAQKTASQLNKLDTQVSATAKGVSSGFRASVQQAGYQLQDFIVQVQGGQSALVAFSQQGSQFAGAFGPGGAVVGAVIALGSVLAGVLMPSLTNSADKMKDLETAAESLNKIVVINSQGIAALSNDYARLAATNAALATQLRDAAIAKYASEVENARDAISNIVEQQSSWLRSLNGGVASVKAAGSAISTLEINATDYNEAIKQANEAGPAYNSTILTLSNTVEMLSSKFDISRQSSFELVKMLNELANNPTPDNVTRISQAISTMTSTSSGGTRALAEFRAELTAAGASAANAAQTVKDLENQLQSLRTEAQQSNFDGISKQLETQRIALTKGKQAAIEYGISQQDLTEQQKEELIARSRVVASLEEKKKAQEEAARNGKREAASAVSVAQKLEQLRQKAMLAADSSQELSREQSILSAQQSLGKGATQEQIALAGKYAAQAYDAAAAIKAQQKAEKEKQDTEIAYAQVRQAASPVVAVDDQFQKQMASLNAYATLYPQKIAEVEATRAQIEEQYRQKRQEAMWQELSQQSLGYNMLTSAVDAFSGNASNAITGLLTGTMSAQEAMRSLGNTILNSVINSIVQVGVEALKNYILGQTLGAASVATSVGLAATTASAWAPAAAMASLASFGANAGPAAAGISSTVGLASGLALAGARYNGGPVSAGGLYQVGEKGKPEIYQASTGKQYMIPGDNGKVISNKDMQSGGGISVQVNVINQSTGATVQSADGYMQDGSAVVDLLITDMERGGPVSSQMQQTFGLSRKAQGAY